MDLAELIRCGTVIHGHPCPPLVLGLRAAFAAMNRLGVGRAIHHELFAFVELGADHYAQGFADGVQFATGCTFGKDLIVRVPQGKASVRLVDQARALSVRVVPNPETIAMLERSEWFRTCSASRSFQSCDRLAAPLVDEFMGAPEESLFTIGPVLPLKVETPPPRFETIKCATCGESVLAAYSREVEGRRVCIACADRPAVKAG